MNKSADDVKTVDKGKNVTKLEFFIFLPFNQYWEVFLNITIFINFIMNWYIVCFNFQFADFYQLLYYIFEIMYFMDTVAMILHRRKTSIRKQKHYEPKSLPLIAINVLTLLPLYEIYFLMQAYKWKYEPVKNYTTLKCIPRLIRLFSYLNKRTNDVSSKTVVSIVIRHLVRLILLTAIFSAVWYLLSCWKCARLNWTIYLEQHNFDPENPAHWATICYYVVTSFVSHSAVGHIYAYTDIELVFVLFMMYTGFMLHSMIFFGELTAGFIFQYRNQNQFTVRLDKIVYLMDDWSVDRTVQKNTIEYYNAFWEKRAGIRDMPRTFYFLPLSMCKEVAMDIFWEALRHSHIFVGTDTAFKRSISMVMKSEFLLRGDYLFRANEPKTKMVFIVSGVIQVLSEEDDESPILSFSSGTVLSETACLIPTICQANVKTATYCELQTLDLTNLFKVVRENHGMNRYLLNSLYDRIKDARDNLNYLAHYQEHLTYKEKHSTPIKLLKRQWRNIFALHTSKKIDESLWKKLEKTYCSQYMDLLVMSEELELKVQAICLTSSCPFIMDPDRSFHRVCDYLVVFVIFLQVLILPFVIFFMNQIPWYLETYLIVMDLVYLLDVYLELTTAVKIEGTLTANPRRIVLYRIKQLSFIVDVTASFPWSLIIWFLQYSEIFVLAKTVDILKLYKIFSLVLKKEKDVWINSIYIRVLKYVVLIWILTYFLACALFTITCFRGNCKETGWYKRNNYHNIAKSIHDTFRITYFYSISIIFSLNLDDTKCYRLDEIVLLIFAVLVGYFVYSFTFAELTASTALRFIEIYSHHDEVVFLKNLMKRRLVSKDVRQHLVAVMRFNWQFNENSEIQGDRGILKDASEKIKSDIVDVRFIGCLKLVPLFSHIDLNLLKSLSRHMRRKILPKGTNIYITDSIPQNVYVILRGYCEMVSNLPGDKERGKVLSLKRGDLLAPLELLHRLKMFGPVYTITAVEVMKISYQSFIDILKSHRSEYALVRAALKEHMEHYYTILMRKGSRLPPMISAEASLGKIKSFKYITFPSKIRTSAKEEDYREPFRKLRVLSFLRFFLLRRTIDPHGKFYLVWEIHRGVLVVLDLVVCSLYLTILLEYISYINYVTLAFRILCAVDMYVRMHCQYYNELGLVVTHPLYTAKHYLKTSFAMDLVGALPLHLINIPIIFGTKYVVGAKNLWRILTKPVLIHRLYNGLSYLEKQLHYSKGAALIKAKFTILIVLILAVLANLTLIYTCEISQDGIDCSGDNWMTNSPFKHHQSPYEYFAMAFYFMNCVYTNSSVGVFGYHSLQELLWFIVITIFLWTLRMLVLAKFTSATIGRNIFLSTYQAKMKQFLKFAKEVKMDERFITATVKHNEYIWKETQGTTIYQISRRFDLHTRIDLMRFLYQSPLRLTRLFHNASATMLQRISTALQEVQFTKDAEIIRVNDVQSNVYIVYNGQVDVTIAGMKISTFGVGGVFGCLTRTYLTRQTIGVKATMHTILLMVHSKKFFRILNTWENEYGEVILTDSQHTNLEFMEPVGIAGSSVIKVSSSMYRNLYNRYSKFVKAINKRIKRNSSSFEYFEYILNVHISPLYSILILVNAGISGENLYSHIEYSIGLYLLDVVFLVKIFFNFTLYYIDHDTGLLETNPKKIFVQYARSMLWFDLFTCFPFELFTQLFMSYSVVGTLNRSLKYVYLHLYYNEFRNKLAISKFMLWTYLIYRSLFEIHVMGYIWFLVACYPGVCKYVYSEVSRPDSWFDVDSPLVSILVAYSYVMNLFTSTGLRLVAPSTTLQLMGSILISSLDQYIIATLASGFANLILFQTHIITTYKHKIENLNTYLKGRHLSPPILQNVWEYLEQLWNKQKGEWMPMLIHDAPSYLKEDIMQFLYGHHLENHFLFAKTHKDFLRQLVVHMERHVYLPGNSIVQEGDIDNTMYFIHKGEVGAFHKQGLNEAQLYTLSTNMTFGEAQGLNNVPYSLTFKALTIVDILALNKKKWQYLLKWFPASEEELKQKSNEYNLCTTTVST